jgi:formate-dependent phosphoribosylglycinamide formyltransferase (GAR transformylase)
MGVVVARADDIEYARKTARAAADEVLVGG